MVTHDEIAKAIVNLIDKLRTSSATATAALIPMIQVRFTDLLDECVDLQKELLQSVDSEAQLLDLQKKLYTLEARAGRVRAQLLIVPSVFLLYCGAFVTYYVITFIDVPQFIKNAFGVEAPERLISLGIAGAFVYLATSLLSKLEAGTLTDPQLSVVANFSLRLSLAIVVPIVLVALFFTKEGQIGQVKASPELLSFACGYSAKLVVDVFNKVVEKGTKMIEAI